MTTPYARPRLSEIYRRRMIAAEFCLLATAGVAIILATEPSLRSLAALVGAPFILYALHFLISQNDRLTK